MRLRKEMEWNHLECFMNLQQRRQQLMMKGLVEGHTNLHVYTDGGRWSLLKSRLFLGLVKSSKLFTNSPS